MKWTLMLVLTAGAFSQQIGIPGPPLLQLKEYLRLTDAQYQKLFENSSRYQQEVINLQQRIFVVQREISIETERPTPDPMALGVRYAEIELNCRAMDNEAKLLRDRNQALLDDAQKTRLKALDDALKLYPIISQAQQASLLDSAFPGFLSFSGGPTGAITGGLISPYPIIGPGCQARGGQIFPLSDSAR